MRARQAERPWFRSWWMTREGSCCWWWPPLSTPEATVSLCFTLFRFTSLLLSVSLQKKFCCNKQHCWLVPIDSTHTKTCCVRFHFLRKYPVFTKTSHCVARDSVPPFGFVTIWCSRLPRRALPRANPFPRLKAQSASKPPFPRRRPARSCCA